MLEHKGTRTKLMLELLLPSSDSSSPADTYDAAKQLTNGAAHAVHAVPAAAADPGGGVREAR
jgi:hypothetical protein